MSWVRILVGAIALVAYSRFVEFRVGRAWGRLTERESWLVFFALFGAYSIGAVVL